MFPQAATHDELQLMPLVKEIKRERCRRRLGGCKGVFQHNTMTATDTGTLEVFELRQLLSDSRIYGPFQAFVSSSVVTGSLCTQELSA